MQRNDRSPASLRKYGGRRRGVAHTRTSRCSPEALSVFSLGWRGFTMAWRPIAALECPDAAVPAVTEIPKNVLRFERLMYLALIIGIVFAFVHPGATYRDKFDKLGSFAVIPVAVLSGFYVIVVWLIARRRNNIFRWLLLIVFAVVFPLGIVGIVFGNELDTTTSMRSVAQNLLQVLTLYFVFTGDARDWYRKPRKIDPTVFD
jgi:hypothetical protein